MKVVALQIAETGAGAMRSVNSVRAVTGRGLEGDRYFLGTGTYSRKPGPHREATFIEIEAIEALERDYGIRLEPRESRRNVVTRGVALNHLVGREFRAGGAVFRGEKLCEPCGHLERLAGVPAAAGLVHRGGLRARVVSDGTIEVGDSIIV